MRHASIEPGQSKDIISAVLSQRPENLLQYVILLIVVAEICFLLSYILLSIHIFKSVHFHVYFF